MKSSRSATANPVWVVKRASVFVATVLPKVVVLGALAIALNSSIVMPAAAQSRSAPTLSTEFGNPPQDWSLAISSIEAPPNGSTLFQDSVSKELGPFNLGTPLKAWKEIDSSL